MTIVNLTEIQRDPDSVIRRVENGETIRIVRGTVPVAEITPVVPGLQSEPPQAKSNGAHNRPFGLCAAEFTVPSDFDAPLPDDVLRDFEG